MTNPRYDIEIIEAIAKLIGGSAEDAVNRISEMRLDRELERATGRVESEIQGGEV